MDIKYLKLGILGLSNSIDSNDPFHTDRGWFSGHWPCAVIAAYYFCQKNPIEKGAEEIITKEVDTLAKEGYEPHQIHIIENKRIKANQFMKQYTEKITSDAHPFTVAF